MDKKKFINLMSNSELGTPGLHTYYVVCSFCTFIDAKLRIGDQGLKYKFDMKRACYHLNQKFHNYLMIRMLYEPKGELELLAHFLHYGD